MERLSHVVLDVFLQITKKKTTIADTGIHVMAQSKAETVYIMDVRNLMQALRSTTHKGRSDKQQGVEKH